MEQLDTPKQGRRRKLVSILIFAVIFSILVIWGGIQISVPALAEDIEILSLLPDQLREAGIFFENNEEKSGTIYIPEECANYGIWDEAVSTCTLIQDLTDNIEITENNISLDCDGHSIVGSEDGYGILLDNKEGTTVKNCIVTNFAEGIYLSSSSYNTISNNTVSENKEIGIALDYSNNNDLINNIANSNTYAGLFIYSSKENIFRNNAMNNNQWNFFFSPFLYLEGYPDYSEFDFDNDIDTSNTVNGKPIYFIKNATNQIYDSSTNAGVFYCISCKNVVIKDLNLSNNGSGVVLWESDDSRVENCNISNNYFGIELYFSDNNILINNNISENKFIGALLFDSNNNKVFHNNFINNNFQAINFYIGINNLFDNGYPDGGNYWSDYTGIDEKSGENQDQSGSDGIGDTLYIFAGGQDRYPFMNEGGWQVPQRWSFAIITDLHIGDGFLDYGSPGWDDSSGQESTYSIRNLKNIIARINSNKEKYNIAFVVVDGDFTNSAELSELNKAKDILNNLEIPWIPIIGNHDVWPYTFFSSAPEVNESDNSGTDKFFNDIFNSQYEELRDIFQNWEKASVPVWNPETDPYHFSFFQNFTFDFNGYHFIGFDFNHRDNEKILPGSAAEGNLHIFSDGTWYWLVEHLKQYSDDHPEEQEKIILFAHHPFRKHYSKGLFNIGFSEYELNTINNFLKSYKDKIAFQFAGHTHDKQVFDFKDIMPVVETQANVEGPVTRIVQVYPDGKIDYSQLLPEKMMIIKAHSPVDLEVVDPSGLTINKQLNEITGASYFEEDIDEDGDPDDIIEIPERKMGEYQIRVIPEDGATPKDTYTLEVSTLEDTFGYVPTLLAENTPISEIPTQPYIFQSKERKVTQITYTGELNGQYSDQVNLSAILIDADGNLLANKTVIFQIGEQSISVITNENGIASTILTLNQIPGQYYLVEADFAGDEDYLPSFDSEYFEILKENTIINVIEKEGFAFDEIILEAEIKDDDEQIFLLDAEVEFKIDGKTLGIVKINEEGIATISWQVDLIPKEITENYPIEVVFAGNDYYQLAVGQVDFILKSAEWLKQDAISELEKTKTGDKKLDKEIDKIIWFINQSLNENLWLDASRLVFFEKGNCNNLNLEKILDKDELDIENISLKCLKSGIVAFYYEKMAVKLMMLRPVFETVIENLVKTDKLLAQVSLFDAQNTPIKNPKFQKIVENQIKKAEQEIQKGEIELQKDKLDRAITRFGKSWLYSQLAIKFANWDKL